MAASSKQINQAVLGVIALVSFAFGAFVRFDGLGTWPLTTDEYLFAKSVENILQTGLPEFPCGGYYDRGIALQYLAAPLVYFIDNNELALRIWPVLFNILAIIPLFFLAKSIAGRTAGYLSVILFSLSLWEIEIARYARMYAPFQAIFITYLLFLYKIVVEGNVKLKKWLYVLSCIGLFVYEAAIFLFVLNFFPLLYQKAKYSRIDLGIGVSLLVAAVMYMQTNFRRIGVENYLPHDVSIATEGGVGLPVQLPKVLATTVPLGSVWFGLMVLVAVCSFYCVYRILNSKKSVSGNAALSMLVLFALLNQFGLVIYSAIVFLVLGWLRVKDVLTRRGLYAGIATTVALGFWLFYTLFTTYWHALFDASTTMGPSKILVVLFKYPDVFDAIIYEYMFAVPGMLVLMSLVLALAFIRYVFWKAPAKNGVQLLLLVTLVIAGLVGVLITPYHATLYTFFLYPAILVLMAVVIASRRRTQSARKYQGVVGISVIALVLWMSEDYNFKHMYNIDSQKYNYRENYAWPTKGHFIYREDYRTPAKVVNRNKEPDDIVISALLVPEYYLDQLDYQYRHYTNREFKGVSACEGAIEIWTRRKLIYKENQLLHVIRSSPAAVWLIVHSENFKFQSKTEKRIHDQYRKNLFYTGDDGMVAVYRIDNKTREPR